MEKIKFLMSDTAADVTTLCRTALEQKGVDVTVVEKDGHKVLQKMLALRPQVVLLDAFMPGLDAITVKQRYHAAGEARTVFFVTGAFQNEQVEQELLDAGFAFDGDADRCIAVDGNGNEVDGDAMIYILGKRMKARGTLNDNTVVTTIMSNSGFVNSLAEIGIKCEQTKVGDRYVLERMREIGASLGGEQSGHIIFLDENTTGDGLLSALHLLQVIVDTGKPLSELAKVMEVLPQALVNAKVANHKKDHYLEYPEIAKAIDELTAKFAGEGRVLIRPSGTEPLVRVMIEGKDKEQIQEEAEKLAVLIQDIMF